MIKPDQRRYYYYFSISLQQPATLQTNLIYKKTPVRTLTKINRVWENQREIYMMFDLKNLGLVLNMIFSIFSVLFQLQMNVVVLGCYKKLKNYLCDV